MSAYYNENDPYAAQWLRNLIAAGHVAPGEVDGRSILDVRAADLVGYTQCHFFAGIGGWSHALRLAGWSDGRAVWTGSCPCQPLSVAGQQRGHADERHLWPAFHALIAQCRPATVFGEQVASKDGREWFAGVRADLEGAGYACGAADLSAAGAGAPHIRQRLYWVANHHGSGQLEPVDTGEHRARSLAQQFEGLGSPGGLADADGGLARDRDLQRGREQRQQPQDGRVGRPGDADDARPQERGGGPDQQPDPQGRQETQRSSGLPDLPGFWSAYDLVPCSDGKTRRTGPGIFPLADRAPARVGRLRAYGNAIVPPLAAEFIAAFMDLRTG